MKGRGRHNAVVAAARRKQILDAASECFRRKGFRGASMMDISESAGLSTGHIYHYFENKEAIVEAVVDRGRPDLTDAAGAISSHSDLIEALLRSIDGKGGRDAPAVPALVLEVFAEASRNSLVARLFEAYERSLEKRLEGVLKSAQASGVIDQSADVDRLGRFLKVVLYGLIVHTAMVPGLGPAELRHVLDFFSDNTFWSSR
ncbi:TetR/AcrR family transcriptional regulator [Telmatospirillum siberiense]|nr:TetR/AcrR family transcriptional regulator [Telmatospirillum siberiense]